MQIMALDIASHAMGICEGKIGDVPTFSTQVFHVEGGTRYEIGAKAVNWIATRLQKPAIDIGGQWQRPDFIYIEAPLAGGQKFHRSPDTAYLLGGLAMTIGAIASCKHIPVREGRVNTIRAHFIGNGNMPGEEAKRAVRKRCLQLGWEPKNNDESDAGALWHWACSQQSKSVQTSMNLKFSRAGG